MTAGNDADGGEQGVMMIRWRAARDATTLLLVLLLLLLLLLHDAIVKSKHITS